MQDGTHAAFRATLIPRWSRFSRNPMALTRSPLALDFADLRPLRTAVVRTGNSVLGDHTGASSTGLSVTPGRYAVEVL